MMRVKVQQRGQRVLDLVGEAGGERAERGEPVGAPQLVLQLAHHGDVAEHARPRRGPCPRRP